MEKQAEAETEFSPYDLIEKQTAALAAYRESLAECQRENQQLIKVARFYADRENWMKRTAQMDNGAKAREILKEVVGYE
jgi:hypothetical protein